MDTQKTDRHTDTNTTNAITSLCEINNNCLGTLIHWTETQSVIKETQGNINPLNERTESGARESENSLLFSLSRQVVVESNSTSVAPDLVSPGVICLGWSCLASAWVVITFAALSVQLMCGACARVSFLLGV